MQMLLCIPVEVDADTTARKVIRAATKNLILDIARKNGGDAFLRDVINKDAFLVRALEATQPKVGGADGAGSATAADNVAAPKGSSGVG